MEEVKHLKRRVRQEKTASKAGGPKLQSKTRQRSIEGWANCLFSKSNKTSSGCWEIGKPYGTFYFRGASVSASRLSWMISHGRIPIKLQVLHKCDNPKCINPNHLFLGTQKDNIVDCVSKGRISRGAHRWASKLTDDLVRKIRMEYSWRTNHCGKLSQKYRVSKQVIHAIIKNKQWRHVS